MSRVLRFAWKTNRIQIAAVTALLAAYFVVVLSGQLTGFTQGWQAYLDSPVSFMTLFVAVLVWYGEVREQYLGNLPKRMTVSFVYQGKEIMRCNRAILSHEGDMRALAQQIGRQMAGNQNLDLRPMLHDWAKCIETDEKEERYMHYRVTIELWKLLPVLNQYKENGKTLLWDPPHTDIPQPSPNTRQS